MEDLYDEFGNFIGPDSGLEEEIAGLVEETED
jgi:hypothetical protein